MTFTQIRPHDIRVDNSPFVYTCVDLPAGMEESIRHLGILNPPRVWTDAEGAYWCVTGSRRIRICARAGISAIPVQVYPAETDPVLLFRAAIEDNSHHRTLNLVECGRIIAGIQRLVNMGREEVMSTFFPILGLPPHQEQWLVVTALAGAPDPVAELVAGDKISFKNLRLLLQFDPEQQRILAEVIRAYDPGANRQQQLLSMTRDGIRRFDTDLVRFLEECGAWPPPDPGEQNIPQRTAQFMDNLHRRLWPTLSRREDQFRGIKERFSGLGPVRLDHYPYFEKREYRLEITFRSPEELRRLAHQLDRDETEAALRPLFEPLPDDED